MRLAWQKAAASNGELHWRGSFSDKIQKQGFLQSIGCALAVLSSRELRPTGIYSYVLKEKEGADRIELDDIAGVRTPRPQFSVVLASLILHNIVRGERAQQLQVRL